MLRCPAHPVGVVGEVGLVLCRSNPATFSVWFCKVLVFLVAARASALARRALVSHHRSRGSVLDDVLSQRRLSGLDLVPLLVLAPAVLVAAGGLGLPVVDSPALRHLSDFFNVEHLGTELARILALAATAEARLLESRRNDMRRHLDATVQRLFDRLGRGVGND